MRIRSVGAMLAAAAFMFVPWGDGETATAMAGESTAPGAGSSEPDPIEPPATPVMQRRVDVEMERMTFSPTTLDVKLGETVTFVFTNTSLLIHDAFIGDKAAQGEHEKQMREMKDTHDHAGHEGGVTVHPGETAAMRHRFDRLGTFEIGCHQLRHYDAGMKMLINVNVI
jgi:uncharacterized cupredoxin-like copper-binding protein